MFESPLRVAILAQVFGGLIAYALLYFYQPALHAPLLAALTQGACAAFVSYKLAAPRWWLPVHIVFMPLVVVAMALHIPPHWYLVAFILLLLVFWRTDRSRVPLYLSNSKTAEAVAGLLPPGSCRVLDIGCGDGSLLRHLARQRPDIHFTGIEHAPATWLWAKLASLGAQNLEIRYGDFWPLNLGEFDVVYAFLSPVPMADLWKKVQVDMRGGADEGKLLISNSFAVPDVAPSQTVAVDDRRETQLYCYHLVK